MTVPELLGILLAIAGLAFAFESPRQWFLRVLRLHRDEPRLDIIKEQQLSLAANTSAQPIEQPEVPIAEAAESISVQKIIDAINSAPPFQRDTVAAHYSGISVEWEGFLRSVEQDPRDNSMVMVNLITDKSRIVSYSIWFSAHPDRVPEIKALQRDSKIRVRGTIRSASGPGLCVTISLESVHILERAA